MRQSVRDQSGAGHGAVVVALIGLLAVVQASPVAAAAEAMPDARATVLLLANGDYIAGSLAASDQGDRLHWKCDGFADLLQFPLRVVQGVRFGSPAKLPMPEGDTCLELTGGDLIFGNLAAVDEKNIEIDVRSLGRVLIDRSVVRRLDRQTGADLIFSGLNGLDGWQGSGNNGWREIGGHLVSDQPGTTLFRDLRIPAQAKIEIDLSWSDRPNFELSLGVARTAKTALRTFAVDVWDDQLVAVCEAKRDADVAVLKKLPNGSGRISLHIYLDQQAGHMIVATPGGESLADLTTQAPNPQTLGGLRLTNTQGNLRLENLRVYKWNSAQPHAAGADQGKIIHASGSVTSGHLVSYSAENRRFVVQTGDAANELDQEQVQGFLLTPAAESQPQGVRATTLWGMRVSGELVKVENDRLFLRCPGIESPIMLPIAEMQAVSMLKQESVSPEPATQTGRLELAGIKLHGSLIDGREGETTCLVWQPTRERSRQPAGAGRRRTHRLP